jgi:hypothetical protein
MNHESTTRLVSRFQQLAFNIMITADTRTNCRHIMKTKKLAEIFYIVFSSTMSHLAGSGSPSTPMSSLHNMPHTYCDHTKRWSSDLQSINNDIDHGQKILFFQGQNHLVNEYRVHVLMWPTRACLVLLASCMMDSESQSPMYDTGLSQLQLASLLLLDCVVITSVNKNIMKPLGCTQLGTNHSPPAPPYITCDWTQKHSE